MEAKARDPWTQSLVDDMREHNGQITRGPMAGRPLMLLTTTGAKSGEPREAIVTFTRDRGRYVIAASKSGAPEHPQWYRNILTNPLVQVEADGGQFAAQAKVTEGAERDRLWDQHATERPEFQEYPKKTSRVIPMIVLERVS